MVVEVVVVVVVVEVTLTVAGIEVVVVVLVVVVCEGGVSVANAQEENRAYKHASSLTLGT